MTTYGSVCSGIEAASVAWEPLEMRADWLSEIEPFPSAVLAHHWPEVPNLGDMTQLPAAIRAGMIQAPDVLVGGTPCQAFSVAGLRKGLDDHRGQLTLTYVDILNAIDEQRPVGDEAVCVWENVPGVLSSRDNAFGCFLAALVGEDVPLEPSGKKWTKSGVVFGPQRTAAWRILDAQYFGVAQRRRRVFVVASARNGFEPCKVLFESEGVRRDTPPSRETPPPVAALTANGVGTCGADDNQAQAGHIIRQAGYDAFQHHNWRESDTMGTLTANLRRGVCGDTPLVATAFETRQDPMSYGDIAGQCSAAVPPNGVHQDATVRRLTPNECARLQGFDDNHARIPWRNKPAEDCPDGPQYKAYGNSKAVPVVRWLGKRLLKELIK